MATWTDFSSGNSQGSTATAYTPTYSAHASPYASGYATPHYGYNATPTSPYQAQYTGYAGYGAYGAQYPGYGYQTPVDNSMALALYNPMGTLDSFGNMTTPQKDNTPPRNPFTPGLEPRPAVPAPVSFVSKDPRFDKFPCSTKQQQTDRNDPLAWITPTLFDDTLNKVEHEKGEKKVSLKELKESSTQPVWFTN